MNLRRTPTSEFVRSESFIEEIIQGFFVSNHRTIVYNAYFIPFFRIQNRMVRDIPHFGVLSILIWRQFFCVSQLDGGLHLVSIPLLQYWIP